MKADDLQYYLEDLFSDTEILTCHACRNLEIERNTTSNLLEYHCDHCKPYYLTKEQTMDSCEYFEPDIFHK